MSTDSNEAQLNLLTAHERSICAVISTSEAPHHQRAQALLAVDEGVTQQQAADRSGLSLGQVKYWLGRFRQDRLEIFPDYLLLDEGESEPVFGHADEAPLEEPLEIESQDTATETSQSDMEAPPAEPDAVEDKKPETKKKKDKKKKKKDKKGKDKKPKKDKTTKGKKKKDKKSKKKKKGKKSK